MEVGKLCHHFKGWHNWRLGIVLFKKLMLDKNALIPVLNRNESHPNNFIYLEAILIN